MATPTSSLQTTVDQSCARLEATATAMGITLSKSLRSVRDLEQILVALKEFGAEKEVLTGATFMAGAYLGEILRAELGGEWQATSSGELVLEADAAAFAPVAKVRKFAADPEGADGLVFFASAAVGREV